MIIEKYFSLIIDSTSDLAHIEQVTCILDANWNQVNRMVQVLAVSDI